MRRAIVVFLLAVSTQAATVVGTVCLRHGQTRTPLAGVRVLARAADRGELVQSSTTDSQGRYQLLDLPGARLSLSASKPGYLARAAAGKEPSLVIDLTPAQELAGADFEVLPGSVITGRITDQLGEPLEGVQVSLWRVTRFGGRHLTSAVGTRTDDRGIYRAFGLEPGRYILLARPPYRFGSERTAGLYFPGSSEEARAQEIEAGTGEETAGIDMTMGAEATFRVAGKVVEVEPQQLSLVHVGMMTAGRNMPGRVTVYTGVDAEGSFTLAGLPAGSYLLTASIQSEKDEPDTRVARQMIELRGDLTGLVVRPGQPGLVTGRVIFAPTTRARPGEVRIRFVDRFLLQTSEATARAPDYRFEIAGLWAGNYTVDLVSPADAYLKKVTQGSKPAPGAEISVPEGGSAAVELEVAFDLGRVSGMVKAPGSAEPLPHARVALARTGGSPVEFRSAQTDQKGYFSLSEVRPGEYLICAWPTVELTTLYAPETWEQAGRAVRTFAVEPGAQVELELTAVGEPGGPER